MVYEEIRAPESKTGENYATRHIVVRPETGRRINRLMPGRRYTDQIIFSAIAAYCSMQSGARGLSRYIQRSAGLGKINDYYFQESKWPVKIQVKIENNPVTGEDELFFHIAGFESVLGTGKRLRRYFNTKNKKIKERYSGKYLESEDSSEPVWYNAEGIFLIFQQVRMNIPIKERAAMCRMMYKLMCFCDSFVIGTSEQYNVIDYVRVFDADW